MLWVEAPQQKLIELARLLDEVRSRFESLGSEIDERIQGEGYLSFVRKAFRTWMTPIWKKSDGCLAT
jgi:hypothetical protein